MHGIENKMAGIINDDSKGGSGTASANASHKRICTALLAHVDAGKTTLSEAMLYLAGSIRKLGRVDNKDAFLDTFELERERGITIFSKQARFEMHGMEVTLLDTPGHVDFSAEMERTLQVLDYAVMIISGADGVQAHTQTLWRLLKRYQVPVFFFVNKMDQDKADKEALLSELKKRLDENCVDFSGDETWKARMEGGETRPGAKEEVTGTETFLENVAMCDERLLEKYLESGRLEREDVAELVAGRKIFPCYFGSALKVTGVEEFMRGFLLYTRSRQYPARFGAKVYKIARDAQGTRLTYLKVTGGTLKVKDVPVDGEKVNQIRMYSGVKYETVGEVEAGEVCAVTGLGKTFPGEGLGGEPRSALPVLEPVLGYRLELPPDCEVHQMLLKLRQLEEEEPLLHIVWVESLGEIHAQLMGEVQVEVLKRLIWDRFGVRVEFGVGNIIYKETIAAPVEGVGHFEPLRHYAEVHLLLEPGEAGSGLVFSSDCSEDMLDRNWQRLILTHLEEREHKGVLTGSAITDMRVTLVAGRAHLKHTEGGDFRQATYRAVRQGLMKAGSVLLEPYYEFRLEVPTEAVGRALADLQRMNADFEPPIVEGELSVLSGNAPVSAMQGYQTEVISYTKGRGRMFCSLQGYRPCKNVQEVVEKIGYDPERDTENLADSVFCSHGAGFVVKWDEVEQHMHVEGYQRRAKEDGAEEESRRVNAMDTAGFSEKSSMGFSERGFERFAGTSANGFTRAGSSRARPSSISLSEEDEREIERMALASRKKREQACKREVNAQGSRGEEKARMDGRESVRCRGDFRREEKARGKKESGRKEYLLVDGYNIIFAWDTLRELAEENMDAARGRLMDVLCNYQGMKNCNVILVFDAYKLEGFLGEVVKYHNIHVVYTKEAETADRYIEKVAHEIGRKYHVTVATSDATEQVIIRGQGCYLISARELEEEVEFLGEEIRKEHLDKQARDKNYLFHYLKEGDAGHVENIRLGRVREREGEKKHGGQVKNGRGE